MNIIITGIAGFIGMHVAKRLVKDGHKVTGIDNLNDYYDIALKIERLEQITKVGKYNFHKYDVADFEKLKVVFAEAEPEIVIHLAAQAGVRYSIKNPHAYVESNLTGFVNILELCKTNNVKHLVYASSSSVYGLNSQAPFSECHNTDHPLSLYGATKKANEVMAHSYSHLFRLPTTGLRFFTVYGPWGRPDMAPMLFADAILKNRPIQVFNNGQMFRDFTFVDDITEAVVRTAMKPPTEDREFKTDQPDPASSIAPWRLYNIGNNSPVSLMNFILTLEKCLGKDANKVFLPMQMGDVFSTEADTKKLQKWIDFKPQTSLEAGVGKFLDWYEMYIVRGRGS